MLKHAVLAAMQNTHLTWHVDHDAAAPLLYNVSFAGDPTSRDAVFVKVTVLLLAGFFFAFAPGRRQKCDLEQIDKKREVGLCVIKTNCAKCSYDYSFGRSSGEVRVLDP